MIQPRIVFQAIHSTISRVFLKWAVQNSAVRLTGQLGCNLMGLLLKTHPVTCKFQTVLSHQLAFNSLSLSDWSDVLRFNGLGLEQLKSVLYGKSFSEQFWT